MPSRLAQKGQRSDGQKWLQVSTAGQEVRSRAERAAPLTLGPTAFICHLLSSGLLEHARTPFAPVLTLLRGRSFGIKKLWVQIPALTLNPCAASVQLLPLFALWFAHLQKQNDGNTHLPELLRGGHEGGYGKSLAEAVNAQKCPHP